MATQTDDYVVNSLKKLSELNFDSNDSTNEAYLNQLINNFEVINKVELTEQDLTEIVSQIRSVVSNFNRSSALSHKFLLIFANLVKNENFRSFLTEQTIIDRLIQNLKVDDSLKQEEIDLVLQNLRALGNLCFENEQARTIVLQLNGVKYLNELVEKLIELRLLIKINPDLIRAICGCAVNLIGDDALGLKQLQTTPSLLVSIGNVMMDFIPQEPSLVINFCILLENLFPDSCATVEDLLLGIQFDSLQVVEMLKLIPPDCESVSDLLHILRLLFSQKPTCSLTPDTVGPFIKTLIELYETNRLDEEAELEILQLWHVLLSHSESMHLLYNEGTLYRKSIEWFINYRSTEHQLYAILFFGCFAAARNNSKQIVANHHHLDLIRLLSKSFCQHFNHQKDQKSIQNCIQRQEQVQRASLAAMRNLAIPAGNSVKIFNTSDLFESLFNLTRCAETSLAEELLELVRVLIAGSTSLYAKVFTMNKLFMDRCIHWEQNKLFPVLRFQVQRLAAIILQVTGCFCKSPEDHHQILLKRVNLLLTSRLVSDRFRALNALQSTVKCILGDIDSHNQSDLVEILFSLFNALSEWAAGNHLLETFDQLAALITVLGKSDITMNQLRGHQKSLAIDTLSTVDEKASHLTTEHRMELKRLTKLFFY